MPDQILSAFVAKLKLYGFRPAERRFPEFLRILENEGARRRLAGAWSFEDGMSVGRPGSIRQVLLTFQLGDLSPEFLVLSLNSFWADAVDAPGSDVPEQELHPGHDDPLGTSRDGVIVP